MKEALRLKGSPAKVKRTYTPVRNKQGIKLAEGTGIDSAKKLIAVVIGNGVEAEAKKAIFHGADVQHL